jgi:hypothetical protein
VREETSRKIEEKRNIRQGEVDGRRKKTTKENKKLKEK